MENLVNCGQNIKTKGQLFDLIRTTGLFTDEEEEMPERKFTIAQLQKIWNERCDKIVDGGR